MHFLALASDYDGTLAGNGVVDASTVRALERWQGAGGRLILVTGRELPDLKRIFPQMEIFDSVVAENGGVLFEPRANFHVRLADPPSRGLIRELKRRGLQDLNIGETIIDTERSEETVVRNAIRDCAPELRIILNKNSLMVLPAGVDKGTGLAHALARMQLPRERVVAVGDAENDVELFECCGYRVAVANAIPDLQQRADWITSQPCGAGVAELVERLLSCDGPL